MYHFFLSWNIQSPILPRKCVLFRRGVDLELCHLVNVMRVECVVSKSVYLPHAQDDDIHIGAVLSLEVRTNTNLRNFSI